MHTCSSPVSRVRLLALVLLMCLLVALPLCGLAADTLQKVPVSRMIPQQIEGLVYEIKFQDGFFHLEIDSDATNWQKVLLHSGATNQVLFTGMVRGPEWATQYASITGNVWETDEEILRELQYAQTHNAFQSSVSMGIAAYTEEKEILSPVKTNRGSNPLVHAIRWSDGNGRNLYEVMEIDITHTSMLGRKVTRPKIDMDIVLATNATNVPGVTAKVEDGHVTYTFDPDQLGASHTTIETRLKAPAGAAELRAVHEYSGLTTATVINDEYAVLLMDVRDWQTNEILTGIHTSRDSLIWYDANGNVVEESGTFSTTRINEKVNKPWTYYVQQDIQNGVIANAIPWKPVQLKPYDVIIGHAESDRLEESPYFEKTIDPETAHVHISMKKDQEVSLAMAQEIAWCGVTYAVMPPEGAVSVSWSRNTRNHFYGRQPQAYEDQLNRVLRESRMPLTQPGPIYRSNGMFERLNTPIKNVVMYSMGLMTKEDFGATYTFCWFDQNGDPIEIHFLNETADPVLLEPDTASYTDESQIKHPVKGPVFIDGKNTGWKLRAEYHVQEGSNAYIVELHMEDKHGNPVYDFGNEKLVFYLPYREHEDFDKFDFYLMHYEGGNLNNGLPVNVTKTPNGIRFEVDNLSPFVVSWEGGSDAPDGPLWDDVWANVTELECISSDPDLHVGIDPDVWGPTPGLLEAGQRFPNAQAIHEQLCAYVMDRMPEADGVDTFELIPMKKDPDGRWYEIWPDELPEGGIDVYIPFGEGIPAGAKEYLFVHLLAHDNDRTWAGTFEEPEILEMYPNGMMVYLDSLSPVAVGWINNSYTLLDTDVPGTDEEDFITAAKEPELRQPTPELSAFFKDANEIKLHLNQYIRSQYPVDGAKTIELIPLKWDEEKRTWTEILPEDFAKETNNQGMYVTIPYGDGIPDPSEVINYYVTHMVAHGPNAVTKENLPVQRTSKGLKVHLTSMSPVIVGWEYQEKDAAHPAANVPKTGDSTPLWLLGSLLALSGLGAALIIRRRKLAR